MWDALPANVHLTLPRTWRSRRFRVPAGVVLHHADVPRDERAWFGAVPRTNPRRSLNDCAREGLSPDLLRQAVLQAIRRGLVLGEPEIVVAKDVLAFAGIAPPTLRLYPIETHLAEKLHAHTMPRSRPSSRVKDLADLALLATAQAIDARRLRAALEKPPNTAHLLCMELGNHLTTIEASSAPGVLRRVPRACRTERPRATPGRERRRMT